MLVEYKRLVDVIKAENLPEAAQKEALKDIIRLYAEHLKKDEKEALYYTKSAILHLFKNGRLRGLTEDLKGLKPTYIHIMDAVTPQDMQTYKFTDKDTACFIILREKLEKELAFIENSNESVTSAAKHEYVNIVCSLGLDDEVYALKEG